MQVLFGFPRPMMQGGVAQGHMALPVDLTLRRRI